MDRESTKDVKRFARIKEQTSKYDQDAYRRLRNSIQSDKKAFSKSLPRWYKYRLVEVKVYALCFSSSYPSQQKLLSTYIVSRINGSELQRHNDFLNANLCYDVLLSNLLCAHRYDHEVEKALVPVRRIITQKN